MTMFGVWRRLQNGNLKPICSHLGADVLDARRRAVECGCLSEEEPALLIETAAVHDPSKAPANGKVSIVG